MGRIPNGFGTTIRISSVKRDGVSNVPFKNPPRRRGQVRRREAVKGGEAVAAAITGVPLTCSLLLSRRLLLSTIR
ncbi:hypothetical protein B296_00015934 [Ensete ventricosum]|nr:hypothetical protein B296_00015934 [Ensete ventricosum]